MRWFIAFMLIVNPVMAMQCGDRAELLKSLSNEHKEAVVGRGLAAGGAMIELYRTKSGETWTVVGTSPADPDVSCIITDGKDWSPIKFNILVGEKS